MLDVFYAVLAVFYTLQLCDQPCGADANEG